MIYLILHVFCCLGSDEGAVFGALITNASGNFLNEGIPVYYTCRKLIDCIEEIITL